MAYTDLSVRDLKSDSISVYLNEGASFALSWTDHRLGKLVFDISIWKLEVGNHLYWCRAQGIGVKEVNTMNEGDNRGCIFMLNDDMTVSTHAPQGTSQDPP